MYISNKPLLQQDVAKVLAMASEYASSRTFFGAPLSRNMHRSKVLLYLHTLGYRGSRQGKLAYPARIAYNTLASQE